MIHHYRMARNCPCDGNKGYRHVQQSSASPQQLPQLVGGLLVIAHATWVPIARGSSCSSSTGQGAFCRSYLLSHAIEHYALASCERTSSGAEDSRAAVAKRSIVPIDDPIDGLISTSDRANRSPQRSLLVIKPRGRGSSRTTSAGGMGLRMACTSARRADASAVCAPAHPTPPAEAPGGATRRVRRAPSTPTSVLAPPRVRPA